MHAVRIKNLSIALEAISRINGCRSEYDRIRDLLSEALDKEKESQKAKAARPAKSAFARSIVEKT
jgi:hypothetical protein